MTLEILVAGSDIHSLPKYVEGRTLPGVSAKLEPSEFRDQALVAMIVSGVVAGATKMAFDLLKDYIKEKWLSAKPVAAGDSLLVRAGDNEIALQRHMSPEQLDRLIEQLLEATQSKNPPV